MMDLLERVAPDRTAVVVIDVQNDFVHPDGKGGLAGRDLSSFPAAVEAMNRLLQEARRSGVPCLFVRVEHGPRVDKPPYRDKYEPRGMYETDTLCHEGSWGAQFADSLAGPLPDEPVFVKHGYDPFYVPGFEESLQDAGTRNLIVVGVVTNLCVAAAVASAFERGYFVVVPVDCTAASNAEAGKVSLETIQDFYGEVVDSSAIVGVWRQSASNRQSTGADQALA